jgi:peptidoglycan hydrolase CwlO-like protein
MKKPLVSVAVLSMGLAVACVNSKVHQQVVQKGVALEAQMVRSNKEIADLREQKLVLQDEIKSKNEEISQLRKDLNANLKSIEECTARVQVLSNELNSIKASVELQKSENQAIVLHYENRVNNLLQELTIAKTKKKRGRKLSAKVVAKK